MGNPVSQVSAMPIPPDRKARDTARDFEAVFAGQVAKLMLESVEQDGGLSGGHGEEMFRGILAETLGNAIARGRGLGVADQVRSEIELIQRAQNAERGR